MFFCEPEEVEALITARICPRDDGWAPEELAAHVREEYSALSWPLEPAGFVIEEVSHTESQVYAAYGCRRQ